MRITLSYHVLLVVLSVVIAVASSFVALNYVRRVIPLPRSQRRLGLAAGAVALGSGIWTMHFTGIMAMRHAAFMRFDGGWTVFSWALAVVAAYAALTWLVRMVPGSWQNTAGVALLLASGICAMHYSGMQAMQGMRLSYNGIWCVVAFFFAGMGAAIAAWAFQAHLQTPQLGWQARLLAALGMGGAISGMHYTAMAGTTMTLVLPVASRSNNLWPPGGWLAVALCCAVAAIMGTLLLTLLVDKQEEVRARRRADLHYRALFDNNPDLVVGYDATGVITEVNAAALRILGYTPEEMQGKPFTTFIAPADRPLAWQEYSRVLRDGSAAYELNVIHKNGTTVRMAVTKILVRDETRMLGVFAVGKDVTDRYRTEEALLQAEKLRVAGQLAAGVAHEIRNPLTAIRGFLQLLQERVQAYGTYFAIMFSELNRIDQITGELLAMAKPQFPVYQPCDLEALLAETVALMSAQANLYKTELVLSRAEGLPPVQCDQNRIKQVFVNLIKNAIEAMPQGGQVVISAKPAGSHHVEVTVCDNGPGIPPDVMQRIGTPFITTKPHGTGLGLMVCAKIIYDHGGELTLDTQPAAGTRVCVCLPVRPQPSRPTADPSEAPADKPANRPVPTLTNSLL
ncbi:MAG: PAS domain S-box protein [Alicyclobacillus sp.]|nr:PAS domain S-box protein [Alicyclobacillus sp.]